MKKTLLYVVTGLLIMLSATAVSADGTTTEETCTTNQYGETTCTTTTTENVVVHEPVDAALGDINPALVSSALIAGSYFSLKLSKKVN